MSRGCSFGSQTGHQDQPGGTRISAFGTCKMGLELTCGCGDGNDEAIEKGLTGRVDSGVSDGSVLHGACGFLRGGGQSAGGERARWARR